AAGGGAEPVVQSRRLAAGRLRLAGQVALLQLPEVGDWVAQAVRVVDPQPGGDPRGEQVEGDAVGGLEHRWQLDADGGQVVDVEEPAVVDLLAGDPPERGAV